MVEDPRGSEREKKGGRDGAKGSYDDMQDGCSPPEQLH